MKVYCAISYFDHLDRVRDDPQYAFVLSECNNMIAMLNFQPGRTQALKSAVRSKRVELVNAFFLESTINLSGGEALVRLGIEGLRWQHQVFGSGFVASPSHDYLLPETPVENVIVMYEVINEWGWYQ